METIACPSCNTVNSPNKEKCTQCGVSLVEAKFQHSIDEIRKATERLKALTTPTPSFSSFNGFGTTLLDYRMLADGTYQAVRWVIAMGLPVIPLTAYVIQPASQEFSYGRATSSFQILDKVPLSISRVIRVYLLAIIGLLPIVVGFVYSSSLNRTLGGPMAFFAMLGAIAWAIYIVFFRLKNDSKAYKKSATSQS